MTSSTVPDLPGPRVLVAGDTHANTAWWRTLVKIAARHECAAVIQLGDFGILPAGRPTGPNVDGSPLPLDMRYLHTVASLAEQAGVLVVAVDGNHDDHPAGRAAFPADERGLRPIVPGVLWWADRGARWEWAGIRFGALGGAVSHDRFYAERVEGLNWWPTERTTDADVDRLGDGALDVLVTHDAPAGVSVGGPIDDVIIASETFEHRQALRRAVERTAPRLVMHGHHHCRFTGELPLRDGTVTRVEGLADDGNHSGDAWAILDLADLSFTSGRDLAADHQFRRRGQRSR